MSSIRFLLVNAIDTKATIETCFPNLGLGYIASSLRKEVPFRRGHTVEFKVVDSNVAECIKEWQPDLVGITAVSQNYNNAMEYAKIAKSFGLPVIMGGVHISALPQTLTANMDVGIVGEGERTIVDLISLWATEGKFYNRHLAEIDGIVFHNGDKLVETKARDLIQTIDNISFPARDILKIDKSTSMFTSRGCPYNCTFCFSTRFWNRVRFFSAEYVVEEIELLYKTYGVRQINFWDDLFIADRKRLSNIIDILDKKGLLGKISYTCNARSNLVTDELIQVLKVMGVKAIGMGFESGCQSTLEYLKGKNITVEDHTRAIEILRANKLSFYVSFIIGSPFEDRDSILETIKFIKYNKITEFSTHVLTPYPGTPVWEYAKGKGLVSDNMDWGRLDIKFGENSNPVFVSEKLIPNEIRILYNQMEDIRKHYARKSMVLHGLKDPLAAMKYVWVRCSNVLSRSSV